MATKALIDGDHVGIARVVSLMLPSNEVCHLLHSIGQIVDFANEVERLVERWGLGLSYPVFDVRVRDSVRDLIGARVERCDPIELLGKPNRGLPVSSGAVERTALFATQGRQVF